MSKPTAVIVEDEVFLALYLQDMCEEAGFDVLASAASERQSRERFAALSPDVLVTDMELIDGSRGTRVVSWMRARCPDLRVVFVTGASNAEVIEEVEALHPAYVLSKPVPEARLVGALTALAQPDRPQLT